MYSRHGVLEWKCEPQWRQMMATRMAVHFGRLSIIPSENGAIVSGSCRPGKRTCSMEGMDSNFQNVVHVRT